MVKLPYTLLFVTLALVVLNILLLRHVSHLDDRVLALEQIVKKTAAQP